MDNLNGNVSFIPQNVRKIATSGDSVVPIHSSLRAAQAWTVPMAHKNLSFDSQGYVKKAHTVCFGHQLCAVESWALTIEWSFKNECGVIQ